MLATVPNARLVLAGRGSEELTGPNVSSLGYVLDLNDVYANARVAIAPLRSGAGTRLKILEGLAHGVPVVSTSIGAEGLALEADRDFVLADSPEAFASAVVRLLSDDAWHETLANQGATAVAENYGWEAIGANAMLSLLGLWETTP